MIQQVTVAVGAAVCVISGGLIINPQGKGFIIIICYNSARKDAAPP